MIVISENGTRRECVEQTPAGKGKKTSRTFHQTLIGGVWEDNAKMAHPATVRGGKTKYEQKRRGRRA
jgi:hypothetical protein